MLARRLFVSILGLAALAVPASASMTLYTSATDFNNATTELFFPDPLTSFDPGALTVTGLEYDDAGTGTDFFGFTLAGDPAPMTVVNNNLRPTGSGRIKIALPNDVYAFAATVTVPNGFGVFCIDIHSTFGTCDYTFVVTSSSDHEFIGIVSSVPMQTIWLGSNGGSYTLSLENFEVGEVEATPEVATVLLIGSGLIFLPWLRRWQRRRQGA